ncbi:DNA-binding protein [Oceanospirillum maris]|uniref:DNA-binding protein n=1 Tax=Oceanospirillum maris TaxID=64977 RepID=UPI00048090A0|nr:DNA-binding protein [Oceanospirillum maris]
MARNGISYNEVKQAVDEMQAEGLNPTIAGIRERLGTGSFTTISEHLKLWRAERQQQPMVAGGSPAPDSLNGMVQAVWQQAREDATKALESYKEEIQKTLEHAEAEKQQAVEETLTIKERCQWLDERNQILLVEMRQLEKKLGAAEITINALEKQQEELKQKNEQQNEHHAEEREELEAKTILQQQEYKQALSEQQEHYRHELQQRHTEQSRMLTLFEQQLAEEKKRGEALEQHWIMQVDDLRLQLKEREQHIENSEKEYLARLKQQQALDKDILVSLKTLQSQQGEQQKEHKESTERTTKQLSSLDARVTDITDKVLLKSELEEIKAIQIRENDSLRNMLDGFLKQTEALAQKKMK